MIGFLFKLKCEVKGLIISFPRKLETVKGTFINVEIPLAAVIILWMNSTN